mgnify:CR=1 FL=1
MQSLPTNENNIEGRLHALVFLFLIQFKILSMLYIYMNSK